MGEGAVLEGQHLDTGELKNSCPEMEEMLFLLRGDGRGEKAERKHVYAI